MRSLRNEPASGTRSTAMKQYLLSMYQPQGDPPPPEILQPIMQKLGAIRQELVDAGAWVFGDGLCSPDTATVLRPEGGEVLVIDGPFTEGKEYLGGFMIIKVPDLDAALTWGGGTPRRRASRWRYGLSRPIPGTERAHAPSCRHRSRRRAARPAPARRRRSRTPATSSGCSARSTVARSPSWPASLAISTSPKTRSRRHSRPRCSAGLERAYLPAQRDGSSPRLGTGRSTVFAKTRPAKTGTRRPLSCTRWRKRRRTSRGGTRARRPAAPHLHLLSPGAGHGRPGRADAPAARRPHHR